MLHFLSCTFRHIYVCASNSWCYFLLSLSKSVRLVLKTFSFMYTKKKKPRGATSRERADQLLRCSPPIEEIGNKLSITHLTTPLYWDVGTSCWIYYLMKCPVIHGEKSIHYIDKTPSSDDELIEIKWTIHVFNCQSTSNCYFITAPRNLSCFKELSRSPNAYVVFVLFTIHGKDTLIEIKYK